MKPEQHFVRKNEANINGTSQLYLFFCRTLNNLNKSWKGP